MKLDDGASTMGLSDEERTMLGEICIIRARMAAMRENAALTTELSNRALDLLPEDELHLRGDVALDLGHAYCSVGDSSLLSKRLPGPPLPAGLPTTSGRPCSPSGIRRLRRSPGDGYGRRKSCCWTDNGWPSAGQRECRRSPASSTRGWASCSTNAEIWTRHEGSWRRV